MKFTEEKSYLANKGSDNEVVTVCKVVNEDVFARKSVCKWDFLFSYAKKKTHMALFITIIKKAQICHVEKLEISHLSSGHGPSLVLVH